MAHRRDILRRWRISGRHAFGFLRACGCGLSHADDRPRDKPQALPRGRGAAGKYQHSSPNSFHGSNFAQIYPDRAYLLADVSRARAKFPRPAPGVFYLYYSLLFIDVAPNALSRHKFELYLPGYGGYKFKAAALCFYLLCLVPIFGLFLQVFFVIYFSHFFFLRETSRLT